jgi:hypothetical protein
MSWVQITRVRVRFIAIMTDIRVKVRVWVIMVSF